VFEGGVLSYIAYSRFNYKISALENTQPFKVLQRRHFNYCSNKSSQILKKDTTNFFTKAEIQELQTLYLQYTQDIDQQSKQILRD
jgi:hypothetical protein